LNFEVKAVTVLIVLNTGKRGFKRSLFGIENNIPNSPYARNSTSFFRERK
jgi:hypothetical protein